MSLEEKISQILQRFNGQFGIAIQELPNGPIFKINSDSPYRAASVIKLPIIYELLRLFEAGEINLDSIHEINSNNMMGGMGVISYLNPSLKFTIKDLATLMMIVSDNSATNELIDLVSMDGVNSTMNKLGLSHTVLKRKMLLQHGSDLPFKDDNTMSPSDCITLLRNNYCHSDLSADSCNTILNIMKDQQIKSKIPRYLSDDFVSATKSGELKAVSNDIGIIYHHKDVAISVLSMGLTHTSFGADAIAEISNIVANHYS